MTLKKPPCHLSAGEAQQKSMWSRGGGYSLIKGPGVGRMSPQLDPLARTLSLTFYFISLPAHDDGCPHPTTCLCYKLSTRYIHTLCSKKRILFSPRSHGNTLKQNRDCGSLQSQFSQGLTSIIPVGSLMRRQIDVQGRKTQKQLCSRAHAHLECSNVGDSQLSLVIQHLLKVGHVPGGVSGVAVETLRMTHKDKTTAFPNPSDVFTFNATTVLKRRISADATWLKICTYKWCYSNRE